MIQFLYTNLLDTATLTSKSAATGYPAANVQSRFLKQTWRSTGLANEWLKFNLGSAKAVNLFTFFYNNLTSSATVKLYGHASDLGNTEAAWSGATYQATFSGFDDRAAYVAPANTLQYWLLAISDGTNPAGYIEIGRCYSGTSISPSLNFNENFTETTIDPSEQNWTVGGHLYSTQRERYKEIDIQFMDMSQADQTILRNFFKSVYKTEPFVIALDGTNEPVNLTRYGVLISDLDFQWTTNNRINCSMRFRELR